jgi:hypothetical protein
MVPLSETLESSCTRPAMFPRSAANKTQHPVSPEILVRECQTRRCSHKCSETTEFAGGEVKVVEGGSQAELKCADEFQAVKRCCRTSGEKGMAGPTTHYRIE